MTTLLTRQARRDKASGLTLISTPTHPNHVTHRTAQQAAGKDGGGMLRSSSTSAPALA